MVSIKELMENQVSTRFMLSMSVVVGTFLYAWFGPMRYGGDAIEEMVSMLKFVVGAYLGSKTLETGLDKMRGMK